MPPPSSPRARSPTGRPIYFSEGDIPYGVFCNRAQYNVYISGKEYATAEHYYQAQKFTGTGLSEKVRLAATPGLAAQYATKGTEDLIRADWPMIREDVLERACYAKFSQHPELKEVLLSTGSAPLVQRAKEPCSSEEIGENALGLTLQRVRQQLVLQAVGSIRAHLLQQPALQLPACPRGVGCAQIDDEQHRAEYCHPCPKGTNCVNSSPWHLQQFLHGDEILTRRQGGVLRLPVSENCLKPSTLHLNPLKGLSATSTQLPLCAFLFECKLLKCPGHDEKFTHFCPEGYQCTDFSIEHRLKSLHAEECPVPCPAGLRCSSNDDLNHLLRYSHPCPQGLKCQILSPAHVEFFTHEAPSCPYGLHCWRKKFKDHTVQYTHPCPKGHACRKQGNLLHCRMYTHEELDQFGRPAAPPVGQDSGRGLPGIAAPQGLPAI